MTVSTKKPSLAKGTAGASKTPKKRGTAGASKAEDNKARMQAAAKKAEAAGRGSPKPAAKKSPPVSRGSRSKSTRTSFTGTIRLGIDPTAESTRARPAWAQAWSAVGAACKQAGGTAPVAEALLALAESTKAEDNVINVTLTGADWAKNTLRDGIKKGYFVAGAK